MDEKQIGCLGIGVSAIFSAIATVLSIVGIGFAFRANDLAQEANHLAIAAQQSADRNAVADLQLQSDIVRFQQLVKRPYLAALRFVRVSSSEFLATIQNTGERQAAVFELEYIPQDVKGAGPDGPDTTAVIPHEITAKSIEVDFATGLSWKHAFQNVVVLSAGEVIVLRIKVAASMRMGEFVLHFGENERLTIGVFTVLRFDPPQPSDDLFKAPPAVN